MAEEDELLRFIDDTMNEIADFILSDSTQIILNNDTWDTGALAKSGETDLDKQFEKWVIFSAPYASGVEFGTDPRESLPPPHALAKWARRKLGMTDKKARSVGWAIAHKIKNEGTDPQPFLRPAIRHAVLKFGANII